MNEYNQIIILITLGIYVAWSDFPGQKDYVAKKNVRVIANKIPKKK